VRAALALSFLLSACSGDADAPACPAGETMRNGACAIRFDDCGDHAIAIRGGGCKPAGVTDCGAGFAADGAGGCNAILPPEACADGTYALPGDASCHPVPCDEPSSDGALLVDGRASDGGDGSAAKPFRTFTAALGRATAGATIVVASGTYDENLSIAVPVKIFGRCDAPVLIRGRDSTRATLQVTAAAELHQLSVTGPYVGVLAGNAKGVLLDRLWLHDIGRNPIYVLDEGPGADVTLRDIFIERSKGSGVIVASATATIERLAVRAMSPHPTVATTSGYALHLRHQDIGGTPRDQGATVTVKSAHFEATSTAGIVNESGELRVEGMLLRDVRPTDAGETGYGVVSGTSKTVPRNARVELVASVIERVTAYGVIVQGGSGRIDRCTVSGVAATAKGLRGFGIAGLADPTADRVPAELDIVSSVVRDTHVAGVIFVGAKGSFVGSVARGVQPIVASSLVGDGVCTVESDVTVDSSLVLEASRAGFSVFGGKATLKDTSLRCSPIPFNAERTAKDATGMIITSELSLDDAGGNACGCTGDLSICRAQSSGLEPLSAR